MPLPKGVQKFKVATPRTTSRMPAGTHWPEVPPKLPTPPPVIVSQIGPPPAVPPILKTPPSRPLITDKLKKAAAYVAGGGAAAGTAGVGAQKVLSAVQPMTAEEIEAMPAAKKRELEAKWGNFVEEDNQFHATVSDAEVAAEMHMQERKAYERARKEAVKLEAAKRLNSR